MWSEQNKFLSTYRSRNVGLYYHVIIYIIIRMTGRFLCCFFSKQMIMEFNRINQIIATLSPGMIEKEKSCSCLNSKKRQIKAI